MRKILGVIVLFFLIVGSVPFALWYLFKYNGETIGLWLAKQIDDFIPERD